MGISVIWIGMAIPSRKNPITAELNLNFIFSMANAAVALNRTIATIVTTATIMLFL